jgi:type III restriction enzyme
VKIALKEFQEEALEALIARVRGAASNALGGVDQAVILSAPTGSGKTMITTALIERLLQGDDLSPPDPEATFLWLSTLPEINEQTLDKMSATSEILNGAFTLENIEPSFDESHLRAGKVYFLNTQKLGKGKLLTRTGDRRSSTIWEIIDRTISERGSHLYVLIDEAHHGIGTPSSEEQTARTILQRFIFGYQSMRPAPIVIGITATPARFKRLLEGSQRTTAELDIDMQAVRESGLLKDRIVLHHLDDDQAADMTLLEQAAVEWREYTKRWAEYAAAEGIEAIEPILVVQVDDAAKGRKGTKTPLDQAIHAINGVLGEAMPSDAFAHSFDDGTPLEVGNRTIRYIKPSQISADSRVKVVFFKTALSTGWDCPRAEVMMSFRKAKDDTYIAQLIGRMVRTPLARRVERDETLNSVALFLPHYDADGVRAIITRLQDPEHEYVPPVDIAQARDMQTLEPREGSEAILKALGKIPSYEVHPRRRAKQTIRLMKLARALKRDDIDEDAHDEVHTELLDHLADALKERQKEEDFATLAEGRGKITIGQLVYDQVKGDWEQRGSRDVEASAKNINDLFNEAGRRVGEGLHVDLWERLCEGIDDVSEIRKRKIQVAVLLADAELIKSTENLAEELFDGLRKEHIDAIDALGEEDRAVYRELAGGARRPTQGTMRIRDRIVLPKAGDALDRHLYVDSSGEAHFDPNTWESPVIDAELARDDVIGWLRMVERKDWALQVPYQDGKGVDRPLYPDFLIFREQDGDVVVDLLDPHRPDIKDAVPKIQGLAKYAAEHGIRFGRIESIIVDVPKGLIFRLDLQDKKVREAVAVLQSSEALELLYRERGR